MHGFLIWDYEHRYEEAVTRLAGWVRQGQLKYRETVDVGVENAAAAFVKLFKGENIGKMLVKLS
jgi:NADPH-dependent curcumin reductase CurA